MDLGSGSGSGCPEHNIQIRLFGKNASESKCSLTPDTDPSIFVNPDPSPTIQNTSFEIAEWVFFRGFFSEGFLFRRFSFGNPD